jgi:hypothetical protein
MPEEDEFAAQREARQLSDAYGNEAALYAALKAQRAIDRRDYKRCAKWKRVLEILSADEVSIAANSRH